MPVVQNEHIVQNIMQPVVQPISQPVCQYNTERIVAPFGCLSAPRGSPPTVSRALRAAGLLSGKNITLSAAAADNDTALGLAATTPTPSYASTGAVRTIQPQLLQQPQAPQLPLPQGSPQPLLQGTSPPTFQFRPQVVLPQQQAAQQGAQLVPGQPVSVPHVQVPPPTTPQAAPATGQCLPLQGGGGATWAGVPASAADATVTAGMHVNALQVLLAIARVGGAPVW